MNYDCHVWVNGKKAGHHVGGFTPFNFDISDLLREGENTVIVMLDKIDGLAGTTPWILKDFRSPRRVLPGIQDFYNMKGIMSDKGEKKKSFFVLKQWYEGK